jgi:hypothetical protein
MATALNSTVPRAFHGKGSHRPLPLHWRVHPPINFIELLLVRLVRPVFILQEADSASSLVGPFACPLPR